MNISAEELVALAGTIKNTPGAYKCEYCNKSFKREGTMLAHSCEKKRRWQQKDDKEILAGFSAFDLFYRISMGSKGKDYKSFVDSQYYTAFTKYGNWCYNSNVIDIEAYTRWLINKEVKLRDWASERFYLMFIKDFVKRESVERALERFVEYAIATGYFEEFWERASGYLIADWIEGGKISPWIIICSQRAQSALSNMPSECFERIANCIDADYWGNKRTMNPKDAYFVEEMIDGIKF